MTTPRRRRRIREAGACIGRGFFNEFHGDGTPKARSNETIQFLVASAPRRCSDGLLSAGYVAHLTTKYRPRLGEIQAELVRRLEHVASVRAIDGALQAPRYTSAALHEYAFKPAAERQSGCAAENVIIIPMSKTAVWWEMSTLERHAYFYPHVDQQSGSPVSGHAKAAEHGIRTIYRRLYHNPDGYQRVNEYDFVTYFECADEHLATFDSVRQALRDERRNPEWRFVTEGPEWRGRRARAGRATQSESDLIEVAGDLVACRPEPRQLLRLGAVGTGRVRQRPRQTPRVSQEQRAHRFGAERDDGADLRGVNRLDVLRPMPGDVDPDLGQDRDRVPIDGAGMRPGALHRYPVAERARASPSAI